MVEVKIELNALPRCPMCEDGSMYPLYDVPYQSQGSQSPIPFYFPKGWVCASCGYNFFFVKGEVTQLHFNPQVPFMARKTEGKIGGNNNGEQ